jgi:phosphohistidine phosphatase
MRTLFLLRHAKSSWDDTSLADFNRPLNGRGERDAPRMGELMRREEFAPGVIVCSPAKRAKQTVNAVKEAGKLAAEILLDARIYEASPNTLRQVAAEIDNAHPSAMLVGHNPGMESFLRYLTGLIEPMPTAALAVIELDIGTWSEMSSDSGRLVNVFRPKELTSA